MRTLELNVPPVYVPLRVSEPAAPETPTEPGTVTVAGAEAPGPIVPTVCGSVAPVSAPTLTPVSTTFAAAVPPVFAIVRLMTVPGLDANRHDARTRVWKGETRRGITRLQAAPSRPEIGDTALRAQPLP